MIGDTEDRHTALRVTEDILRKYLQRVPPNQRHALAVTIIEEICAEGLL
ncbi:hypothetical protein HNP02_007102 [Mycobacterium sp. AZCC_0083]|nr:hypothetical protein [Mycobacterium sp. AZCC_0083]